MWCERLSIIRHVHSFDYVVIERIDLSVFEYMCRFAIGMPGQYVGWNRIQLLQSQHSGTRSSKPKIPYMYQIHSLGQSPILSERVGADGYDVASLKRTAW